MGESDLDEKERAFHQCIKPSWGPEGTLIYSGPAEVLPPSQYTGKLFQETKLFTNGDKDVVLAQPPINDLGLRMIEHQRSFTKFEIKNGVPSASLRPSISFEQIAVLIEPTTPSSNHEKNVWDLAGVLFDDVSQLLEESGNAKERAAHEARFRRGMLISLWNGLVEDDSTQMAYQANSKEEAALYHLCANRLDEAAIALMEGRNFRLATLIPMIGGDKTVQNDMKEQLDSWRKLKVLSEMSEPIRALYELLAGNSCVCEGTKGALEDRARTFTISSQFGLDWRQSFNLRLLYGGLSNSAPEQAVKQFAEDLQNGREVEGSQPRPFFQEEGIDTHWNDQHASDREDLLWGLLKLYASRGDKQSPTTLESVLAPENHQLSPLELRLSWQLFLAFRSQGGFGPKAGSRGGTHEEAFARLTLEYAWQLQYSGEWLWAVYVLLHLNDTKQRTSSIRELLARNGGLLGASADDPFVHTLIKEYRIPEQWLWEAKALYARSVEQDYVAETEFLLLAKYWDEAHKSLCHSVAPQAIIAEDIRTLTDLLAQFKNPDLVPGWGLGGQVYSDYLSLLNGLSRRKAHEATAEDATVLHDVLRRLASALPSMLSSKTAGRSTASFHEKVAVQEMASTVAQTMAADGFDKSKILALPLSEDQYLQHTLNLSEQYYRAVMQHRR